MKLTGWVAFPTHVHPVTVVIMTGCPQSAVMVEHGGLKVLKAVQLL